MDRPLSARQSALPCLCFRLTVTGRIRAAGCHAVPFAQGAGNLGRSAPAQSFVMGETPVSRTLVPLVALFVLACVPPVLAGPTVLFLGDSLTAGLGVEPEEAYPLLLGAKLAGDGLADVRVINGGISGSTSASAPARLRWYARDRKSTRLNSSH